MRTQRVATIALLLLGFSSATAPALAQQAAEPQYVPPARGSAGYPNCPPLCPPYLTPDHLRERDAENARLRRELAAATRQEGQGNGERDKNTRALDRNTAANEHTAGALDALRERLEADDEDSGAGSTSIGVALHGGAPVFRPEDTDSAVVTQLRLIGRWADGVGAEIGAGPGLWVADDHTPFSFGGHVLFVVEGSWWSVLLGPDLLYLKDAGGIDEGGGLVTHLLGGIEAHEAGLFFRALAGPSLHTSERQDDELLRFNSWGLFGALGYLHGLGGG